MESIALKMKEFLETEEGKASIKAFSDEIRAQNAKVEFSLERFHYRFSERNKFRKFVDAVIKKYDSREYEERFHYRVHDLPQPLLSLLYQYAEKYGREATISEYKKYGNDFSGSIYVIHGKVFSELNGQGTITKVYELEKLPSFETSTDYSLLWKLINDGYRIPAWMEYGRYGDTIIENIVEIKYTAEYDDYSIGVRGSKYVPYDKTEEAFIDLCKSLSIRYIKP